MYSGELSPEGFIGAIKEFQPTREELTAVVQSLQSERAREDPIVAAEAVIEAVPRLAPLVNDWYGWPVDKWLKFLPLLLTLIANLLDASGLSTHSKAAAAVGSAMLAASAMGDTDDRTTRNRRKRKRRASRNK
jgi:hypothetical protein